MRSVFSFGLVLLVTSALSAADLPGKPVPSRRRLVVMLGGNRQLELRPDGCGLAGYHGGLGREWDFIQTFRPEPSTPCLLLSNGNNFSPGRLFPKKEPTPADCLPAAECMADALNMLVVQAMLVTPQDAWLGLENLRALEKRSGVPFVCANLIDSATGKPAFRTHLELNIQGIPVLIVGAVVPARYEFQPRGVRLSDPQDALTKVLASRASEKRFVILLTNDVDKVSSLEPAGKPNPDIRLVTSHAGSSLVDTERAKVLSPDRGGFTLVDFHLRDLTAPIYDINRHGYRWRAFHKHHESSYANWARLHDRFHAGVLPALLAIAELP